MPKRTSQTGNPEILLLSLINSKMVKRKKKKEQKKKTKIHNDTEQDWDKAKNEQNLGEHDFLKLHTQMGA